MQHGVNSSVFILAGLLTHGATLLGVTTLGARNLLGVTVGVPALSRQQLQQRVGVLALLPSLQLRPGAPATQRVLHRQTAAGGPPALRSRAAGQTGAPAAPQQQQQQQAGKAHGERLVQLRRRLHQVAGGISLLLQLLAQRGMVGGVRPPPPHPHQLQLPGVTQVGGVRLLPPRLLLHRPRPGPHRRACHLLTCSRLRQQRLSRQRKSRWVLGWVQFCCVLMQ